VKRKGETTAAARRGLKEAWNKTRADEQEPDTRPAVAGERANDREAHYPSSSLVVDPAVARRKRLNLPWEICGMSRNRD